MWSLSIVITIELFFKHTLQHEQKVSLKSIIIIEQCVGVLSSAYQLTVGLVLELVRSWTKLHRQRNTAIIEDTIQTEMQNVLPGCGPNNTISRCMICIYIVLDSLIFNFQHHTTNMAI